MLEIRSHIAGAGEPQVPQRPGIPDQELWQLQGQVGIAECCCACREALGLSLQKAP